MKIVASLVDSLMMLAVGLLGPEAFTEAVRLAGQEPPQALKRALEWRDTD